MRTPWIVGLATAGVLVAAGAGAAAVGGGGPGSAAGGGSSPGVVAPTPALPPDAVPPDAVPPDAGTTAGPDAPVSTAPAGDPGARDLPTTAPDPWAGAAVVRPRPGLVGARPHGWDAVRVDSDRRVTVGFSAGVAPCEVLGRVDVAYGATTVTVTLHVGPDPSAGDRPCIDLAQRYAVGVPLREPLRGRTIVDGA